MSLNVGDSIPLDLPESLGPRRLEIGKAGAARRGPLRRALGLILAWIIPGFVIYFAFLVYWPLAAALGLIHAALVSWGWRWRRGLLSLALSPLVVVPLLNLGEGALDYWDGSARRRVHGHRMGRGNLDPKTRTYPRSCGCVVFSYMRPFSSGPYNAALGLMVRAFGPLRGHHSGAYPSAEEAFAALAQGRRATWNMARATNFFEREELAAWLSERLGFRVVEAPRPYEIREGYERIRCMDAPPLGRSWELRIVEEGDLVICGDERMVFLISRSSEELFAVYTRAVCAD